MSITQDILCLSRTSLAERLGGIPLGVATDALLLQKFRAAVQELGEFRPRAALEEDPAFLQVIVQGLVTRGGMPLALFRATREQRQDQFVETRLNARIALAAGGHVEPVEAHADDALCAAMLRELTEELTFEAPPLPASLTPCGIICAAAPAAAMLDRVHIGFVYHAPTTGAVSLPAGSDEFVHLEFLNAARLRELYPRMEGWGQLLTTAILEGQLVL